MRNKNTVYIKITFHLKNNIYLFIFTLNEKPSVSRNEIIKQAFIPIQTTKLFGAGKKSIHIAKLFLTHYRQTLLARVNHLKND